MNNQTTKLIVACVAYMFDTAVFAHDSHSLLGIHWHPTNTLGFVLAAVMVAATSWLSRK